MKKLQKILKYNFKNENLLTQALIHRSYVNEHKNSLTEPNERYEFLGDAVLELWASDTLFTMFPELKEGDLTNLRAMIVRTENLATIAKIIKIGDFVQLSRGEEANGGRLNQSILADTLEAIIGAIYLDDGYPAAASFLKTHLLSSITNFSQLKMFKDPKSLFQEIAQAKTNITPHYVTIKETGPDHKKIFEVGVYLGDSLIATGNGPSKQIAEADASSKATEIINNK